MKAQNTPNNTDETLVKNSPVQEAKKDARSPMWQSVLVGGVPGILIGAIGGALGTSAYGQSEAEEPGDEPGGSSPEGVEIHEAHSVNDDMSFSEAFAAARAEVGPGGAFVWHGHVYGTYRGDDPEWQEMSQAERAEHSHQILSQVHAGPYTPSNNEPDIVPVNNEEPVNSEDPVNPEEPVNPEDSNVSDEDVASEVDVRIVGVDQFDTEDGGQVNVGYGEVDGLNAAFVDSDGDGEVDTVLIDENGDGSVTMDEVYDATGAGITVEDMNAEAEANNAETLDDSLYSDMPDYTNDADTASLE